MGSVKWLHKDCFRNADRYLEEAISLKESNPGHALANAILGQEEVGKGFLIFCIEIVKEQDKQQIARGWQKLIKDHKQKLTFALMVSFALSLIKSEIERAKKEMPNLIEKARTTRDPLGVIKQYGSKIAPPIFRKTKDEVKKAALMARELQELKKRGMYVDILPDGRVSTPFEISKADAEKQIEKLKESREAAEKIIEFILKYPPNIRKIVAQLWLDEFGQYSPRSNAENAVNGGAS